MQTRHGQQAANSVSLMCQARRRNLRALSLYGVWRAIGLLTLAEATDLGTTHVAGAALSWLGGRLQAHASLLPPSAQGTDTPSYGRIRTSTPFTLVRSMLCDNGRMCTRHCQHRSYGRAARRSGAAVIQERRPVVQRNVVRWSGSRRVDTSPNQVCTTWQGVLSVQLLS